MVTEVPVSENLDDEAGLEVVRVNHGLALSRKALSVLSPYADDAGYIDLGRALQLLQRISESHRLRRAGPLPQYSSRIGLCHWACWV